MRSFLRYLRNLRLVLGATRDEIEDAKEIVLARRNGRWLWWCILGCGCIAVRPYSDRGMADQWMCPNCVGFGRCDVSPTFASGRVDSAPTSR